jgi:hypothetical protein
MLDLLVDVMAIIALVVGGLGLVAGLLGVLLLGYVRRAERHATRPFTRLYPPAPTGHDGPAGKPSR